MQNEFPFVLWFTGLSGSGKTTLADALRLELFEKRIPCYLLDGDRMRAGLCRDLGYSAQDRSENIRRISEVAKLFFDADHIVLTPVISPFRADRQRARELFPTGRFVEIFVKCPLVVCEKRDPKGLYVKARAGLIPQFTGLDSPYEEPLDPELVLETDRSDVGSCAAKIISYLKETGRWYSPSPT